MTDKILTWIVILLIGIISTEFLIPGPIQRTIINSIRVETGSTVRNYSVRDYKENAVYFDYYRIRISDSDVSFFNEGDSIEYRLTPIVRNLKTIKNLKNDYQTYIHSYFMLLLLTGTTIVGQVLNLKIKWSKTTKEMIQILIFSLVLVVGYLLIFK